MSAHPVTACSVMQPTSTLPQMYAQRAPPGTGSSSAWCEERAVARAGVEPITRFDEPAHPISSRSGMPWRNF